MANVKPGPVAPLDLCAATPYYRQIYDRVRSAISSGVLKPGDRLPSSRALTQELGLARGTIDAAYSLLAAEGWVVARGQAGTIVTPGLKSGAPAAPPGEASALHRISWSFRADSILPFQMGLPALDVFPRKIWARLGARCVRTIQPSTMSHPAMQGLPELRMQIAAYLQLSRGVVCTPAQVFVTSGYRASLSLFARALLNEGERVWIEDPGYPPTRVLLENTGMVPVPIAVDGAGLIVDQGLARARNARAAVVTPAHQSPMCVSLSLPRRLALLAWAKRKDAWVFEDDYDGEYRYVSRPLPALKSLDRDGRVFYSGTFSKVLFPGLRLAYFVVPIQQVERIARISETFEGGSPELTQSIVAAFMREGHFARHIQKMRRLYSSRRDATVAGLRRVLGSVMRIESPPGGMHLILRLRGRRSDRALAALMRENGLFAEPLSEWSVDHKQDAALLVNFTNVDSVTTAEVLGRRILALL